MSWLDFFAALAGHIFSWPVAVVVAVLVLRKPLAELLPNVKDIEAFGGRVSFGTRLAQAEEDVAGALEATGSAGGSGGPPRDSDGRSAVGRYDDRFGTLARQASKNPSFTVVGAWQQTAEALSELARAINPDRTTAPNPIQAVRELRRAEVIDDRLAGALTELRILRNDVAHGKHNPNAGEALAYVKAASDIYAFLRDRREQIEGDSEPPQLP